MTISSPMDISTTEYRWGTTALVLGILGIVVLPVLAPFALVLGAKGRSKTGDYRNQGVVNAAWILGIIGTIILVVEIIAIGLLAFYYLDAASGHTMLR